MEFAPAVTVVVVVNTIGVPAQLVVGIIVVVDGWEACVVRVSVDVTVATTGLGFGMPGLTFDEDRTDTDVMPPGAVVMARIPTRAASITPAVTATPTCLLYSANPKHPGPAYVGRVYISTV